MASLVLGGIGGFMFGPIGFAVGSLLGNLLFPTHQDGPRLSNLKLQGSSYGQMIPIPYGTIRLAGQVVWQTDLTEHSSGGKGGPDVTTFTYTASFAIKICKGPIAGILKIWANGEIIYDTTGSTNVDNSQIPITIYLGRESALPDPTMEAVLGVGNVPAFRDDCAVVFADWDLGNFGNTLPQLSFEIFASGGPIPYRVSTFTPQSHGQATWGAEYDSSTLALTISEYYDSSAYRYSQNQFLIDGTPVGTAIDIACQNIPGDGAPRSGGFGGVAMNLNALYAISQGSGILAGWYLNEVFTTELFSNPIGSFAFKAVAGRSLFQNDAIYATAIADTGGGLAVARWPAPGGIPTAGWTAVYSLGSIATFSDMHYGNADNGKIYLTSAVASGTSTALWELNESDLTLSRSWTAAQIPATWNRNGPFTVYNGMLAGIAGNSGARTFTAFDLENSFAVIGSIPIGDTLTGVVRFQNGLCVGSDGVYSLDPPQEAVTLASIVTDVSERTGLTTGDIDVSQLTDLVDGYLITSQADARTDIDQLRSAYFFDAVESAGLAKFVKRGAQPVVTIPDNDLAAQQIGDTPPALMQVVRAQEVDLPAQVNVTYLDSGAAYQNGSQQAMRQNTLSQAVSSVQLAIAMSTGKARQIANVLLYQTIVERDVLNFKTSRKYLYLEPSDVISAHGWTIRIDKKTSTVTGVVEFEGVASIPALYVVALASNPTSGAGQPVSGASQPTALLLLDIPMITDLDDQNGLYAGMAGATDDTWRAATLYKSVDGGASYNAIANAASETIMGVSSDAIGDFHGGNRFDEENLSTVVIGVGGGELAGATELAVLNGANMFLLGNEILQAKNCTLTAPSTYVLTGLLRGRRGTEFAIPQHAPGEVFAVLPTTIDVDAPFSELAQIREYKAVTKGGSLAAASAIEFVNYGQKLRPYSPADLGGGVNASGDVVINWVNRTRIGGAWADYTDVTLSEPSEAYILQIWSAHFQQVARIVNLTAPTFTYTAAMQTVDFGGTQQTIFVSVGQVGIYALGTQASAEIPGAGGSNDAPLNPLNAYNNPPPQTGTGCSGTVVATSMNWGSPVRVDSGDNAGGPGWTWDISFTTGSIASGSGRIQAYAGSGDQLAMGGTFTLEPCGVPLPPTKIRLPLSALVSFPFYMTGNPNPGNIATLLPSTPYHLCITRPAVGAKMFCDLFSIL